MTLFETIFETAMRNKQYIFLLHQRGGGGWGGGREVGRPHSCAVRPPGPLVNTELTNQISNANVTKWTCDL